MLQLADLDAQVLAERQVVAALVAAGRWPEGEDWPSVPAARQRFADLLNTVPQRPRQLTAEELDREELHQALGVRRRR